jgi:hypothetical protein
MYAPMFGEARIHNRISLILLNQGTGSMLFAILLLFGTSTLLIVVGLDNEQLNDVRYIDTEMKSSGRGLRSLCCVAPIEDRRRLNSLILSKDHSKLDWVCDRCAT